MTFENEKKFIRTRAMLGSEAVKKLSESHAAVFGIGGVGSFVCESLARSGIGELTIIDNDDISESNINRQLYALCSTVGQSKVEVAKKRLLDINPDIKINVYKIFFEEKTLSDFDFSRFDYVADCIDSVSSKLLLIETCKKNGIKIISAMGAGNKLDPTQFEVADISKTSVCPLCRKIRQELKKKNINELKVVYSREKPVKPVYDDDDNTELKSGKPAPASIAFVPPVMGMIMAGVIIKDLSGIEE